MVLDQSKKRSLTKLEGKRTNLGQLLTQAELIQPRGLVRAEQRGRAGAKELPDAKGQRTNDHLGNAGRVVDGLPGLTLGSLVEVDTY